MDLTEFAMTAHAKHGVQATEAETLPTPGPFPDLEMHVLYFRDADSAIRLEAACMAEGLAARSYGPVKGRTEDQGQYALIVLP